MNKQSGSVGQTLLSPTPKKSRLINGERAGITLPHLSSLWHIKRFARQGEASLGFARYLRNLGTISASYSPHSIKICF
jgi:hypothetical protein